MPMTRVNDIDVNYKLEGDGPETIVLINGLADDLETWAFQMDDFLGAGYRVLRFDNRGIGASSKSATPRFRTPAAAAIAFVAPSILIGVVSTAFTDPGTASGFLGT
jgi:pimeloyl-ACP methyl ester carboxylesterase